MTDAAPVKIIIEQPQAQPFAQQQDFGINTQPGCIWTGGVTTCGINTGIFSHYEGYNAGIEAINHIWDGLPVLDLSGIKISNASPWDFKMNFGATTPASAQQTKKTYNTDNYADCFEKLDNDKLTKLKNAEAEIAKAQADYDKAKSEGNAEAQKTAAKTLYDAKAAYAKLQAGLSKGLAPTSAYGKDFKYSNLTTDELNTIKAKNAEIAHGKQKIAELKAELDRLANVLTQRRNEFIAKGGNPAEFKALPEENEALENARGDVEAAEKEVSEKIEELRAYIKKAGAAQDTQDYHVAAVENAAAKKAGADRAAAGKISDTVANAMYDKDGKLLSIDDILENIGKLDSATFGNYDKEDVKKVVRFMYEQAKGKTKTAFFDNETNRNAFLSNVAKDIALFDMTASNSNREAAIRNFSILRQIYNKVAGKDNAFDEAVNKMPDKSRAQIGQKTSLLAGIKAAKELQKKQSTPTTPTAAAPVAAARSTTTTSATSTTTTGSTVSTTSSTGISAGTSTAKPAAPAVSLNDQNKLQLVTMRSKLIGKLKDEEDHAVAETIKALSPEEFCYMFIDSFEEDNLTVLTDALEQSIGDNKESASMILARLSALLPDTSTNKIFKHSIYGGYYINSNKPYNVNDGNWVPADHNNSTQNLVIRFCPSLGNGFSGSDFKVLYKAMQAEIKGAASKK